MAKWGEGDPRWIVEERPDHTNVNNWHWTEKNACVWSKEKLKEILVNTKLDNSIGSCKITQIEQCEGDASANNRKAKIIIFYEWDLKLKWKGKVGDKSVEGKIEIPNLSDENGMEDLDVNFTTDSSASEAHEMKDALRKECTSKVKELLESYTIALKREFTEGMILPAKEKFNCSVNNSLSKLNIDKEKQQSKKTVPKADGVVEKDTKLKFCSVRTSATMKCTASDLFNALMKPEMFIAFTNGSGRIDPKINGKFEMFGGNVSGYITEIDAPKRLVQKWRLSSWPDGVYSHVTFEIKEADGETEVTVVQTGVPEKEVTRTKEGWETFYWAAMKKTFGFGSLIL